MKILRITAQGLPLFKKDLDICFYTQQRVCEEDKDSLYRLTDNYYLHSACAFIGINASGKTSVLKVISLALNIVKNEPINHVEAKSILGGAKNVTIRTYFYDKRSYVCCLETVIAAKKSKTGEYVYSILSESLWEKPIAIVKSKKYLTDFTGMKPVEQRNSDEAYLSDDVSFVIAYADTRQRNMWSGKTARRRAGEHAGNQIFPARMLKRAELLLDRIRKR